MKNSIKITLLALLVSLNTPAFEQINVDVPADSPHEECFFLDTETVINYRYKSSEPLDFNLHYHDDNGMTYLVDLPKSSSSENLVKDLINKQVYCLMWFNSTTKNAELNYEFSLEK
ncbi:hypothetical protein [Thalassotalea piscium]|uniref:Uncharacterized protein n=1 Tax=Thalassotalea piscium TaxID=1230533 RepID=A0A7X0TU69_9GAMM|nr:hypothetical protein [Thalassotalea piscium]MBB6543780.1 hypothetical protein [Thalassotalea piscium]